MKEEQVKQLVEQQRIYFRTGKTKDIKSRKESLKRLGRAIEQNTQAIEEALAHDLGKSSFEGYSTEIGIVLKSIHSTIHSLDQWTNRKKVKTPVYLQPASSEIYYEPYGVVLIIAPFNYPFQLAIEPLIGALAAGNCVIIKPSEQTVATAHLLERLIEQVFEPQYVTSIQGGKEVVEQLLVQPFQKIFFTGSERVGKVVAIAAAQQLIPVTLELGGKSPVIIDQSANLQHAAERVAWGKWLNVGQTCVAPDYVLVHQAVAQQWIAKLQEVLHQFYGDDPIRNRDYGRLVTSGAVERQVQLLQETAGTVIHGGQYEIRDRFFAPTLVTNVEADDALMQEEIFGPILPIIIYKELPEAIAFIQQYASPLAAYLFTEQPSVKEYFLRVLSFGGGCINDTVSHVANFHLPFGGVGGSGMGAYHGYASFLTFSHEKSIMKRNTQFPMRFVHPPYLGKYRVVKSILR